MKTANSIIRIELISKNIDEVILILILLLIS